MEVLSDIARQVGWIDILDIALVSGVLYAILAWLRRIIPETTARRILFVAPIGAAIYILVRVLDLYLLESVVQVLFIVLLIIAVVVFQSDIRRMFDMAISRSRAQRTPSAGASETINRIAEASSRMMQIKMGALIAIKGSEPLDSHIDGGIALDGIVTQPLLFSIFHPETPGHDGAVVIEDDRIVKFAAHLPLTTDVPYVSRYGGTRHAAALGLAEVSDAFVIVISEERGTIGIAHEGSFTQDVEVSTLRAELETFWNDHYEQASAERPSWWKRPYLQIAGVAALMSILFWLVVVYSPNSVIRRLIAPIEFRNLPDEWTIEGEIPASAEVVLSGPERLFMRLNPADLVVSIDVSQPEEGRDEIVLTETELNLPEGIVLNSIEPQVLQIQMQRMASVRVPVTVRTSGGLPETLTLERVEAEPDSVTIVIPRTDMASDRSVYTQAVDLRGITEDTSVSRRLVLPENARLQSGTAEETVVQLFVRPVDENGDANGNDDSRGN